MRKRTNKTRPIAFAAALAACLCFLWVAGYAFSALSAADAPQAPPAPTAADHAVEYAEAYALWKGHERGVTVWCGPDGEPCAAVMSSVTGELVELHVLCLDGMPCVGEEVKP